MKLDLSDTKNLNISVDNDTLDFSPMTLIIEAKMKKSRL